MDNIKQNNTNAVLKRETQYLSFYKLKLSKDSYLILNNSVFSSKENVQLNVNLYLNKKFRIISFSQISYYIKMRQQK